MLGRPSSELGPPGFLLGRPSSELGPPAFLLGRPSSELGPPGFLLSRPSSELGTPSLELGVPGFLPGRPSLVLGTPSFELGAPASGPEARARPQAAARSIDGHVHLSRAEMKQDSPDPLTFELINHLLDDYAKQELSKGPGPWERWSFAVGLLGAGVGMLVGTLLGNATGLIVLKIGLAIEISGFAISLILMVIREWRSFRQARRTYALELDHDYGYYRALVDKLRAFPLEQREARLRYIRDRKQVMHYRMGLFTGGLEKLGIIPVLVGLYLQFRDWNGDWSSYQQINVVQGLLIWALFLCYAVGWQMIRLKDRVDVYELLLAEANCRP